MIDVYKRQVRSVLEFAAVVWTAGLTEYNKKQIERVQKVAFAIMLGNNYISYENTLNTLKMETLDKRRDNLTKICKESTEA